MEPNHFRYFLLIFALPLASCSKDSQNLTLHCRYNTDFDWLIIGRVYMCSYIGNDTVTADNVSVTTVAGEHRFFKDNNDILAIWFLKKQLHFIPQGIASHFRHIAGMVVNKCHLKEVRQKDMEPFIKLRELYVIENDIQELKAGTFEHNKRLELLWLDGNKIKRIDGNVFDGLAKLRFLNIRERHCMLRKVQYDRSAVEKVIQQMQKKCQASIKQSGGEN